MPDDKKNNELEEINKLLGELDLDSALGIQPEEPYIPEKAPEQEEIIPARRETSKEPPTKKEPPPPLQEKTPPVSEEKPSVPPAREETHITEDLSFLTDLGKEILSQPEEKKEEEHPPLETPMVPEELPVPIPIEMEEKKVEPPPPSVKAEEPKEKGIDLSDDQVLSVHKKVLTLSHNLQRIVKQIIVKETLPQDDLKVLLDYLLLNEDESIIRGFVENKLKIKIEEKPVKEKGAYVPTRRTLKPSLMEIIKHDFIPIIRLAIPVLAVIIIFIMTVIIPFNKKFNAQRLINRGLKLIETDVPFYFEQAENNFNKALKIKKDYYEAYLKYGDAYLNVKKYNKAENKYKDYIRLQPENKEGFYKLGKAYEKQNLDDEAIEQFKKVLKISKNDIQALDQIARIYYYKKDDKENALAIYNKIIEKDPSNIYAHYGKLSIYIWNKDLEEVEREHYQVLKKAKGYYDLGRLTELAQFYINYDPNNYSRREDYFNKAEDTLQRTLQKDNKYSEAYYQYARLYRIRQDLSRAELNIERAIKNKPSEKYYNFLGEVFLLENKLNLAIEQFDEAITINPLYAPSYYNLGNINYYDLGNYQEAKRLYELAVNDLSDKYYDLNYNLGWIYYNEMDYPNANRYFIKSREILNKNEAAINLSIGNTYLKLGKYDLAISEYLDGIDYFREKYGDYPKINLANKDMVENMKLLSAIYNNLGMSYVMEENEKKGLVYFWKSVESAKKLGFSNENPYARANIQYVLQGKRKMVTEPQMQEEIKKSIVESPYEKIPF